MYNDSYTHIKLVLCYITQSLWGPWQTVNNTFTAGGMAGPRLTSRQKAHPLHAPSASYY